MKEYIERGAVLQKRQPLIKGNGFLEPIQFLNAVAVTDILSIPAADVAPIVRCKNCVHGKPGTDIIYCYHNEGTIRLCKKDFYCAYGADKYRGDNNV